MRSQFENNPNDISLKFKSKSKKCRLEINADQSKATFSMETAKTLASKSAPFTFDVDHVNKYFYSSTTVKVDDKQLMVAKITPNDKNIVLSRVAYIMNMRPDFSHFDRKDEVDLKEELKAVTVKFAAPEKVGYSARPTIVDESLSEEFKNFTYHSCNSRIAGLARLDLLREDIEGPIKKEPNCDSGDMPPPLLSDEDIKPKIDTSPVKQSISSRQNDLKQANIAIKECLIRAKILSFDEICAYIKKFTDARFTADQLLPTVESFAVLVQGNWAIKSEILYEDASDSKNPTITEMTGIPMSNLVLARDYLLWSFCQDRKISRIALRDKVKIPDHDVLDLLQQLASLDMSDKMWEFKLPTDNVFIHRHQDIVVRQKSLWKVRKSNKLAKLF